MAQHAHSCLLQQRSSLAQCVLGAFRFVWPFEARSVQASRAPTSMDPELLQIAMAAPGGDIRQTGWRAKRLDQLAEARQARLDKLAEKRQQVVDPTERAVMALTIPGCSALAQKHETSIVDVRLEAAMRLACSLKVRGSGTAIEKVRKLQNTAVALIGSIALEKQRLGWRLWVEGSVVGGEAGGSDRDEMFKCRGFSIMWDEAAQKGRALKSVAFGQAGGKSQRVVEVMVSLGVAFQGACVVKPRLAGSVDDQQEGVLAEWQPWLCPPLFMTATAHTHIIAGLRKAMPIDLCDADSVKMFVQGVDVGIVVMIFDSASSNLTAFSCFVEYLENFKVPSMLLFGQRCLSHQINLSRAAAVNLAGVAGMLYSLSKLMGAGHATMSLSQAIHEHVKNNLVVRYGKPPNNKELLSTMLAIFGLDGEDELLYTDGRYVRTRRTTAFYKDLQDMCSKVFVDETQGSWVHYVDAPQPHRRRRIDELAAAKAIADSLIKVLISRRWEVAALSRWTGIARVLKRVVAGAALNGVLPACLSSLSKRMGITEARLDKAKKEHLQKVEKGVESEDHWLANASRVVRVTAFFRSPEKRWQLGVLLVGGSEVERAHWLVLGSVRENRRKANLSDLADPHTSIIGKSMSRLARLLQVFRLGDGSPWAILAHLGLGQGDGMRSEEVRLYARSLVLQVSSSLFQRLELRHAAWPYKLQWLLSPNTSQAERDLCAEEFLNAKPCCLSQFGRKFRELFPTAAELHSASAKATLQMLEKQLHFTTAQAECEHRQVKDEMRSASTGVAPAPACWRSVCRHLHKAHVARGGTSCALPLGRGRRDAHPALGQEVGLPLTDAAPSLGQAPLALEEGPEEAPEEPGAVEDASLLEGIGGGNPKMLYMNYMLKAHKKFLNRTLSKQEVTENMQKFKDGYDNSPEIQRRWKSIYGAKFRRQQHLRKAQPVAEAGAPQSPWSPMWPATMQAAGSTASQPISALVVSEVRSGLSSDALAALATDEGKFTIGADVQKHHKAHQGSLWGCGGDWHNICPRELASAQKLRPFKKLQTAINKWVDSLDKGAARRGEVLAHFSAEGAGTEQLPELHTWVLLTSPMYNPKVQCYVTCAPTSSVASVVGSNGFSTSTPTEFPWRLRMLEGPSRICTPLSSPPPFVTIRHESSDELVMRLLCRKEWRVSTVKYRMDTIEDTLLSMVVEGEEEPTSLKHFQAEKVAAPDAFLSLLDLPQGSAVQQGAEGMGNLRPQRKKESGPFDRSPAAGTEPEEQVLGAELERMLGELIDEGSHEEESPQSDDSEEDGLDSAESDGDAIRLGASDPVEPSGGNAASSGDAAEVVGGPEASLVEAVVATSAALGDGGGEDGQASSSQAGENMQPSPSFEITEMGYVKGLLPPHDPQRVVGLVGYKRDMSSIFANCHLHPACSVSAGIRRFDVPRTYMAQWLLLGEVLPEGVPRPERLEAGRRHRALWQRPF